MSRYWDDGYDEQFPNSGDLFNANAKRALKGRRGRKALADLRDALMALPEHRLIDGALCTMNPEKRDLGSDPYWRADTERRIQADGGPGVCAIGALVWHRRVKAGADPAEAFDSLPTLPDEDYDLDATACLAVSEAALAYPLAWMLAYRNDETYERKTPEERWQAFVDWIDRELAETAAA